MADSSVNTGASGNPIRVLTGLGTGSADQQVVTLADSSGNLLGTSGAPLPVAGTVSLGAGSFTIGNVDPDVRTASGTMGALNATADGSTSVAYFPQVRLAISGTWVGTITFQVSPDGTTWYTKTLNTSTGGTASTTTTNGLYYGDIGALFFRTIMTAYTSGTATANMSYITVGATVQPIPTRTPVILSVAAIASVTSEAGFSFGKWTNGTATTGVTSYTVTAGKTFRMQAIRIGARFATPSATVTFANAKINLRAIASGTYNATTSALVLTETLMAASNLATADTEFTIPDGLEFPSGYTFGFSHIDSAATLLLDVTALGYEY